MSEPRVQRRAVVTGNRRGRAQRSQHGRPSGSPPRRASASWTGSPARAASTCRCGSRARSATSTRRPRSRSATSSRPTGSRHFAMAAADLALDDARPRPDRDRRRAVRRRRGHRGRFRRRRVRPARAAAAVGQGQPLRRPLPVHRLVLRRQHRPDLHPRRLQGPLRRSSPPTRPAAWTPSPTRRGPCAAAPT